MALSPALLVLELCSALALGRQSERGEARSERMRERERKAGPRFFNSGQQRVGVRWQAHG
jgi:hypothetical protein